MAQRGAGTNRRSDGLETLEDGRHRLVRLAYRFLWNRSDAEDAVQNAMVLVHRKRGQLRDPSKLWSWACRIVVHQSLRLRRGESRRIQHQSAAARMDAGDAAPADGVETLERAAIARWAIQRLPPRQRTAVTLRHLEEMSYERIAQIMKVSQSTVRVHVRAGREAMREAILNRHPDFFASKDGERGKRS